MSGPFLKRWLPGLLVPFAAFTLKRLLQDPNDAQVDVFSQVPSRFKSLNTNSQRVALLKEMREVSGAHFKTEVLQRFDSEFRSQANRVIFESNMAGVEEFSPTFYRLLRLKAQRHDLCREYVIHALTELEEKSGFDLFERTLIKGCARISRAYDAYYFAWMDAVQDPVVKRCIEKYNPEKQSKELLNSYTILKVITEHDEKGNPEYAQVPFVDAFPDVFPAVLQAFDNTIADLKDVVDEPPSADHVKYIEMLTQYRAALSETDVEKLDPQWEELDRKWMDLPSNIEIVHDIESGYGDPLRVKATPDFSLRFLDETYAEANKDIARIQEVICDYYRHRNTKLSRDGLAALSASRAGLYFIPFSTGMSLVFSYSGQSIPNRLNVKKEKGVKIFFDPVETQARIAQNVPLIRKLFANADTAVLEHYQPEAVAQLVWHVAAHEVGHAIYGISNCKDVLAAESVTLLEEPRAELTAMFTLGLLYKQKIITLQELQRHLAHFALDAVRYFVKYSSQALRPYIVFQINAYKTYHRCGYVKRVSNSPHLVFDDTKALDVIQDFSKQFEQMLDFLDAKNGAGLEKILQDMSAEDDFVLFVLSALGVK